ncbi:MAG: hypothetical protein M1821_009344 [Bathelium mastoideum]|nr:MAG: hypothetical protein M1821_009344 [Bathelium mastoideum]
MPSSSPLQLFPSPPKEPSRKLSLDIQRALSSGRPRNVPGSATTPPKPADIQQVVIKVTSESATSGKSENVETIDIAFPPRTSSLKHSAEIIRRRISDEMSRQETSATPRSATPPRSTTPPSARTSPRAYRKREATPERSCVTPPPRAYTLDRKASLRRTGESPTASPQKKTVAFSPVVSEMDTPSRERADSLTGEPTLRRAASIKSKGKSPVEGPHAITADAAISPSASRRTASQRMKQSSPVSTRSRNVATSPAVSDIPSVRSMSPTLVRDNSAVNTPLSPEGIPMRSMFPTYDVSKPLSQQNYQPMHLPPQSVPREALSKAAYSPEISKTDTTALASASASLPLLWDAANGQDTKGCLRTFNLPLHRSTPAPSKSKSPFSPSSTATTSSSDPTTITFGPSPRDTFYSITHSRDTATSSSPGISTSHISLQRHDPRRPSTIPVTDLALSSVAPAFCPSTDNAPQLATIRPKLAALLALDVAAQTPEACALAQWDPNAESTAAAHMAEQAVAGAWEREGCALVYEPRRGAAAGVYGNGGRYALRHPRLGTFPIEVRGDVSTAFNAGGLSDMPVQGAGQFPFPKPVAAGGSISVLHPLSTAAVPTRLATIDVGGRVENLRLDVAQLMQLDSLYIIDVCVAALMGVLVAEERRREALTFAPPPATAMPASGEGEKKGRRWFGGRKEGRGKGEKKGKKGKGKMADLEATMMGREDEDELPTLTKGLLQTLFIGFGAVVWILGVGVKVVAGLVVAGSMMAKKM